MKNIKYLFTILAIGLLAGSALATERYVVEPGKIANGNDLAPYNTWTNAATNIQWAVDAAANGDTVWVSNGTYTCQETLMRNIWIPVTNTSITNNSITNRAMVVISNTITLKSVNGAVSTIIDGNWPLFTNRCVGLAGNGTILDGFTIQHGCARYVSGVTQNYYWAGGGVNVTLGQWATITGTVQNCIIRENIADNDGGGITFYCARGIISNCQVICNTQTPNIGASYGGGGISLSLGSSQNVFNCTIVSNMTISFGGGIFARSLNNSTIQNCLMMGNFALTGGAFSVSPNVGAGATKATLENCTLAGNTATKSGGGVWLTNGGNWTIRNTIIWSNSAPEYPDCQPTTGTFNHCCMSSTNEILFGSRNITNHPLFVNFAGGDYRLAANSPCMNTGTNQSWMSNGIDLDGRARIRYGTVDMGAYETIYNGTIYVIP